MKKILDVTVFKTSSYYSEEWPPENLLEFKAWLDERIESIPKEYRSVAVLEISTEDEDTYFNIEYKREETDDEEWIRENWEAERTLRHEERERKTLAMLKAKYEGSGN